MARIYIPKEIKERITGVVVVLVIIIIVVQVLNFIVKIQNKNRQEERKQETETTTNNTNQNLDIYQQEEVPKVYQEDFSDTITSFLDSCVNHHPEDAYDMLSNESKELFYSTEQIFESVYYNEKFQGNKEYTYEIWKIDSTNFTYKVKIFDNLLSSGKGEGITNDFIEDYITIVDDETTGRLKVNIKGYIANRKINKKAENDNVSISVVSADTYTDYEIYTFKIKNKTDKRILLDTLTKPNTIYLENERKFKFSALVYEIAQGDTILEPEEEKTVKIKFNDAYKTQVYNINFTDIISEESYTNNNDAQRDTIQIQIQQ